MNGLFTKNQRRAFECTQIKNMWTYLDQLNKFVTSYTSTLHSHICTETSKKTAY